MTLDIDGGFYGVALLKRYLFNELYWLENGIWEKFGRRLLLRLIDRR